ncbi:18378_t:CDS:1, partial [Dentiscutata erythropus]
TAKQSTTKITPFFLVYGREARFPFHPDENEKLLEGTFLQRIFELVEILPKVRNNAVRRVEKAQESAKRRHDQDLQHIEKFKKGDLVLVYKASQQYLKSHKLHPKWKGPFVVHKVLEKEVYKLRSIDRKIIKTPINRKLLKKYYST